jgi:hypothetical protein
VTYLPPSVLQRTTFPEASGEDLVTAIRQIEEVWTTCFPTVQYSMLNKLTTPVTTDGVADVNQPSGTTGGSKFDVLWGESTDPAQTAWVQPHGTAGDVAAADVEVFAAAVPVHARVTRVDAEVKLDRYGFDQDDKWIGGLLVTIPCSLMDERLLTCGAGDRILWDANEWYVAEPRRSGWWYSTNVALYVNAICVRRRHGD